VIRDRFYYVTDIVKLGGIKYAFYSTTILNVTSSPPEPGNNTGPSVILICAPIHSGWYENKPLV